MIGTIEIEWVYASLGLLAGMIITAAFFLARIMRLERHNAELAAQVTAEKAALERAASLLDLRFQATAQEALIRNSDSLIEKLKDAHKDSSFDMERRQKAIADLVNPVAKALSQVDEKLKNLENIRLSAYTELHTSLKGMMQDQAKLRQETANLVTALRSPSTRGQWGEMQLLKCLEMAGLQKGIHFDEQVSANSGQRPDIIIKLTGNKTIVIDAKAPLEGYLDSLKDGVTDQERELALERHARHVRDHMRKLGSKSYWEEFETPEFVVMFLPGESYFSAALEKDHTLIEVGVAERVIPATPTTLISLLKAVRYGWRQEELAENAREISALGAELYKSISVFNGHVQRIGKGLGAAMEAYNDTIGSLERNVLSKARKFEDLKAIPDGRSLDAPEPLDHALRRLNAPDPQESPPLAEPAEKRRA